jgi:hypothetical protein
MDGAQAAKNAQTSLKLHNALLLISVPIVTSLVAV